MWIKIILQIVIIVLVLFHNSNKIKHNNYLKKHKIWIRTISRIMQIFYMDWKINDNNDNEYERIKQNIALITKIN